MNPTNEHGEQAREPERIRVCVRVGKEDWIGVAYAAETADPSAIHEYISASALSSRDAEVREVLSGFIHAGVEFDDPRMDYVVMQIVRRDLAAARDLYSKLQAPELQEGLGQSKENSNVDQ